MPRRILPLVVATQGVLTRECLATLDAVKRFVPGVDTLMSLQVMTSPKRKVAHGAEKGTFSGMCPLMGT